MQDVKYQHNILNITKLEHNKRCKMFLIIKRTFGLCIDARKILKMVFKYLV